MVSNSWCLILCTGMSSDTNVLAPSIGIDSEAYLNTVQFIVQNQHNDSFYSYHTIQGPSRDLHLHSIPSTSLRHSAFLIALRQEIWSAFLNQRTFRLPVCSSNDYTRFDSANDFIWTNRILVWCADLLKFCFGEENLLSPTGRAARWAELKAFDQCDLRGKSDLCDGSAPPRLAK